MNNKKIGFNKTVHAKVQKSINESIIFHHIKSFYPISRAKISKDLKISAPSVSTLVKKLIKKNFVVEDGKGKSSSGKKPINLVFNKNIGSILAIDLCSNEIIIAKTDYSGNIIEKHLGFRIIHTDTDLLKKIIKEINLCLKKFNMINNKNSRKQKYNAISIGIPGNVNDEGEIISAPLFKNWLGINLKSKIQEIFNVPVYIENIVNLSAMAESKFGKAVGVDNFVFLEISNGVGAGIFIDGNIYKGESYSAGEIGFSINKIEDLDFQYNIKGKLEKGLSIENIEKIVKKDLNKETKSSLQKINIDNENIGLDKILTAAIDGDHYSKEIIEKMMKDIAILIINLVLILAPRMVVIGGLLSTYTFAHQFILEEIEKLIRKIIPFKLPLIEISKLKKKAGIIGASYMAIDNTLTKIFRYKIN